MVIGYPYYGNAAWQSSHYFASPAIEVARIRCGGAVFIPQEVFLMSVSKQSSGLHATPLNVCEDRDTLGWELYHTT